MFRISLVCLTTFIMIVAMSTAKAAEEQVPAITALKGVKPDMSVFKAAKRDKPIALSSTEDAAKHFSKEALAELKKKVDFEKQVVLIFAWRGSGQDQLNYAVLESFPEQVVFTLKPGRTKDLRPHIHLYALRANVKWRVK